MKISYKSKEIPIALLSFVGIAVYAVEYMSGASSSQQLIPLYAVLLLGGVPLVFDLLRKLAHREFSSDLLAGISIITAVLLEQYLAASLVVLMLSGGAALEQYAVRKASSVLDALARRMPNVAHRRIAGAIVELDSNQIKVGDEIVIFPHEIAPVDGVVIEGHGAMDESYLTGEPFQLSKTPGSDIISGSINGESALVVRALKLSSDSRYAQIMSAVKAAEEKRPQIRRLGDYLGSLYTPLALTIAICAWMISGEVQRFLAILVVATPCPLLIAIPVAIIGSISLCARSGIVIRDPAVLEQVTRCSTMILDKTGTLTYGRPALVTQTINAPFVADEVLSLVAGLEQYSRHPLAEAIVSAARERKLEIPLADSVNEKPGAGLTGIVQGRRIQVTSRSKLSLQGRGAEVAAFPQQGGLECVVLLDDRVAAHYRFRDATRSDSRPFIQHLAGRHHINRILIVSGDREEEVRYLANEVGISEIYASKSPEEKVAIVKQERACAPTLYIGDGINDAPALLAANVGLAFGQGSSVTSEAAGAVIMESSLLRVDEFLHISARMRAIALQSAVGGMALSVLGMGFASAGMLSPVWGALAQEVIDLLAVLNALRVALKPKLLSDF